VPLAITAVQTSVVLQSTGGFPVPSGVQQLSVIILDTGNPAYSAASPLATPYEYQQVNGNNTGTNTLTFGVGGGAASRTSYAGTTPKAFFAGATIAVVLLAEDLVAAFATVAAVAALPLGALAGGYAQVIANQGPFSAQTDITGLNVTVTIGAGRRIRITAVAGIASTVAADGASLGIYDVTGSAQIAQDNTGIPATGQVYFCKATAIHVPGAGSRTYKIYMTRILGSGSLTMSAGVGYPAFINVEDIGT